MLEIQRMISPYNHYNYNNPKYLVFHYIGAKGTAKNNAVYFYNGDRQASAHYYIGETECWQGTEDFNGAWAVGNTKTEVNNTNSINIEMECANDQLYITEKTEQNALELGIYLMKKHNISIANVRTHYEVSGGTKVCPNWSASNWERWTNFKKKLNASLNGGSIEITQKPIEQAKPQENQNASSKRYLYLKSHVTKWNVYPTNVAPVIGNQCGALAPSKYGGLKYEILGNPQTDVYTIQTESFGKVNIYAPKDNDSEFINEKVTTTQSTTSQSIGEYEISRKNENGRFTANDTIYFRNNPYVGSDNPTIGTYSKGESVNYDTVVTTNKYVWISWVSASSGVRRYMPIREYNNGVYGGLWGIIV